MWMTLDLASPPQRFAEALVAAGLRRAWIVRNPGTGGYRASHPELRPLAEHLARDRRDCRDHEAVFLEVGSESGALLAAVIHKTVRGQAQGGVRHQSYPSIEALLHDGLRLALGMTRKNALAGPRWCADRPTTPSSMRNATPAPSRSTASSVFPT